MLTRGDVPQRIGADAEDARKARIDVGLDEVAVFDLVGIARTARQFEFGRDRISQLAEYGEGFTLGLAELLVAEELQPRGAALL